MPHRLIERQVLYRGKKINLEIQHFEDDNGRRFQKESVIHPGAVVILPWLDEKTILLIRNHRPTVGQILIELPAGTLEKGEDPMNAAGRELQEETGYLAKRLKVIGNFFPSPGILSEKMYAFSAYHLQKTQMKLEEGEEIEVQPATYEQALQMIKTGEIHDGKTIATLLLARHLGMA
jgi:ADP-ribose pyrophosphatase